MPLRTLILFLGLVLVTELGDKTMLTALCLAAQYRRPWLVLASTMVALAASSSIAVVIGHVLSASLSIEIVTYISALLFSALGTYTLVSSVPEDDSCKSPGTLLGMFSLVLFSELGDKSQITILALAAQSSFPLVVFLGAIGGFLVVNAIGALAGHRAATRIPLDRVKIITGLLFLSFGILILTA